MTFSSPLSARVLAAPAGQAAIDQTLRMMRQFVRAYRIDPIIRMTALQLIALVPERDRIAEIDAVFSFVRDKVRYVCDVLDVETLATPLVTLQTRAGDCDDKTTLLAALLESIGFPTRFVIAGYMSSDAFEHVYLEVQEPGGEWLPLDPTELGGVGDEPAGAITRRVEVLK